MSNYAPDVHQFHKQRQADAKRNLKYLKQKQKNNRTTAEYQSTQNPTKKGGAK